MKPITRRAFIKTSAAGAVAAGLPFSKVLGANEDIRMAVVGFNSRGGFHVESWVGMEGVRLVALCEYTFV